MALDIGRKGWLGASLEATYGVPETIEDYIPFTENTLKGMAEKISNEAAYGIREKVFDSVAGKKWSEGDVTINADGKMLGYLLGPAMGTINSANVAGSVYDHTFTRNNSSTPKSLTLTNDRVVDRQYFTGLAVKTLEFSVSDALVEAKASLIGKYPITTTSGSLTTASGSVYSFADAFFAFGANVAAAAAATNLKPHDFTLTIENGTEAIFRHGSNEAVQVNHKEFEVSAEGTLFFENVTQRDYYYNNTKNAAAWKLTGVGIGGGYQETLTVNMYRVRVDSHELETGLADFYAEQLGLVCEYDNANSKSADAVLRNTKSAYS